MPDELTPEQRSALHDRLLETKAELEALLDNTAEGVRPVDLNQPIGRLSRIDAIQQQKMNQAHRRRSEVRYRHVLAALAAYREDEYGDCKRCDEPIGLTRLNAQPEAPVCLACAGELERGG